MGCRIPDRAVLPHLNSLNPDMADPVYSTPTGMYTPGCGLDNVKFAWGHDEYMYRMLLHNKASIPREGLAMIRCVSAPCALEWPVDPYGSSFSPWLLDFPMCSLHSCYPWHREGAYRELMNADDEEALKWVLEFNKFDLYSKVVRCPSPHAVFFYRPSRDVFTLVAPTQQADARPDVEALKPYYQGLIDKYLPGKLHW